MESKSEIVTQDNASIEIGTVMHEGREYSSLGSVVDETRGVIVGYPKGDRLATWEGRIIEGLRLHVTSSWKVPRSYLTDRMFAYSATYNGQRYHGRGAGEGMLLRLRASKR